MKKSIKNIIFGILTILTCFSFACAGNVNSQNANSKPTLNVLTTEYVLYTGSKTAINVDYDGKESVKYVCADPKIATVSDNGEITGISAGFTFIDVIAGTEQVGCLVTVKEGGYSVSLGYEQITLVVGGNKTFTAIPLLNGNEYQDSVQFSITNSENAKLNSNGNSASFVADKVGTFVLTAKTDKAESSCVIKVISKTAIRLEKPTVAIENCKTIKWNSVANAQGYAVSIDNDKWIKTDGTEYDISNITNQMLLKEKVRIFVKAVADTDFEYVDSYVTSLEFSHDYVGKETTEATCFIQGVIEYTCSVCDKKYVNENYIEEHEYQSGRCVKCKTYQTEGIVYSWDDNLKCYYVSAVADATLEKAFVAGTYQDSEHGEAPVSYIGYRAFSGCTMLTHVVLPESVKSIKTEAFYGAEKLKVIIMLGVEKLTKEDGNNQFLEAYGLEVVVVKKGFSNAQQAFVGFASKKFDRDKVNFYVMERDGIVKLTHHDTGAEKGLCTGDVYYYDEALSICNTWRFAENGYDIEMSETNHIYVKEQCVFCGKFNDYGIKYEFDSEQACYYVAKNQSYANETVKIISEYSDGFNGVFPVKYVGASAFANNTNIIKVEMPKSVTKIETEAFFGCTKLETVIMPGVTYIGVNEGYTQENKTISCRQFMNCYALKSIVVGESFNLALAVSVGTGDNRCFYVEGTGAVPNQVSIYLTSSDGTATLHAEGATSRVQNMLSKDRVYNYSDTDCVDTWRYVDGVLTISTVKSHDIVDGSCQRCGVDLTVGLTYAKYTDKAEYYVSGYTGGAKEVYVPSTYDNLPVTAIGMNAFKNNTNINKVVMSTSVKTIHGGAFENCSSLHTLIMPGVTKISTYMASDSIFGKDENHHFLFCNKLTTVVAGESLSVLAGSGTSGATQRVFYSQGEGYVAGNTKVCLTSADGILDVYSLSSRNSLLNSTPYHFSSTEKSGCWYYDADGNVAFWE